MGLLDIYFCQLLMFLSTHGLSMNMSPVMSSVVAAKMKSTEIVRHIKINLQYAKVKTRKIKRGFRSNTKPI